MEPASRSFRGDIAFAERQKLNNVTRTARTLSPKREDTASRRTRQAIDPRWDPYSGEITSSDKGKPQSVKPKTFGISLRQVNGQKGNNGDLKAPTLVVERIRKLNSGTSVDTLESRDSPYMTSSAATSLSNIETYPEESPSEVAPEPQPQSHNQTSLNNNDSNSLVSKAQQVSLEPSQKPSDISEDIQARKITSEPVKKIYETGVNELHIAGTGPEMEKVTGSSSDQLSLGSAEIDKELSSNELIHPSNESDNTIGSLVSESKFHKKHIQSPPPINLENTDDTVQAQGPSNLSIATSINSQKSSRPCDNKSNETLIVSESLAQQESLVINRVRTKESPSKHHQITRKALPPGSPIFISMSIPPNTDITDSHLLTKTLPHTPAENSSNDLVAALQAHLDSLAHRRRNITRSIRQMTELMPRDNLLITDEVRLKREHEKRKVAMLREEEAEIKREEHEVGLRLHRAWKRTESGAVYEPTSLWVRRVTGVGKNWCFPYQDLPVR